MKCPRDEYVNLPFPKVPIFWSKNHQLPRNFVILNPKNQELVRIMNYEIMKYKDSLYYEMSKEWASILPLPFVVSLNDIT